jgi:hypothetical protein
MPDEKPNPIEDIRQGLGLLFRAAKTTLEKSPTGEIEEAVNSGAKEVGRAIENVTQAVEEQILRKPSARHPDAAEAPKTDEGEKTTADAPPKDAPK